MRLFELISPSSRADLYAGTTIEGAEKIVSSNKMIAVTPIHSKDIPEYNKKAVSLTRNKRVAEKLAGGTYNYWYEIPVVLVFDGESLKRDLGKRMRPYDDTNTELFRAHAGRWENPLRSSVSGRSQGRTEAEEAIIGNIDNVNKYLKSIIIYHKRGSGHFDMIDRIQKLVDNSPLLKDPRTIVTDKGRAYYV